MMSAGYNKVSRNLMTRIYHSESHAVRRSKDAIASVRYLTFNPRRNRFRLNTRLRGKFIRSVRRILLQLVSSILMSVLRRRQNGRQVIAATERRGENIFLS